MCESYLEPSMYLNGGELTVSFCFYHAKKYEMLKLWWLAANWIKFLVKIYKNWFNSVTGD